MLELTESDRNACQINGWGESTLKSYSVHCETRSGQWVWQPVNAPSAEEAAAHLLRVGFANQCGKVLAL